jgi:AcrR family transcriptional regulator
MLDRHYHHGDLRAALLSAAERRLQTTGVDGLSLRELAREIGVSHAAPRRHFDDRAALLEALAAEGFRRLKTVLTAAALPDGRPFVTRLNEVAIAYVRFATDNPALVDLMSANRHLALASDDLRHAREASFEAVVTLVRTGQAAGELTMGDFLPIGTLLFATLHGIATMANNKMIDPLEDQFIRDTVASLLKGLAPHPNG